MWYQSQKTFLKVDCRDEDYQFINFSRGVFYRWMKLFFTIGRKPQYLSSKKLGIVIPYRNREDQLLQLVPALQRFLRDKPITYSIHVVEQVHDSRLFNRGRLKNIGFDLIRHHTDYVCFHDVDMLPEKSHYGFPFQPTHVASKVTQYQSQTPYQSYFGGVILFSKNDFIAVNGYSNEYWGWGGEDDDLFWRCKYSHLQPIRYIRGEYKSLPHESEDSSKYIECVKNRAEESLTYNRWRAEQMKLGRLHFKLDGLKQLKYEVTDKKEFPGYCHYFVKFKDFFS